MKRPLALLPLLCCLALPALADTDADIDNIFRQSNTVGGAVLVARHGEILYERYYGFADLTAHRAVDENTYFRLASVTKFVSGIGVMRLVENGALDLDGDIGDVLGAEIRNPRHPDAPVTLRQLMTHTSGVNENGGYSKHSATLPALLVDHPSGNFTDRAPGEKYVYSNFGAGIVGALIEASTGQSVQDYMAEHVFAPMGIDAAYSASMLASPEDVASLYTGRKRALSAARALEAEYDNTVDPDRHYRTTVGAAWMRARDLLKLTAALGEGGALDGARLLRPETVALMIADQSGQGSVFGKTPYGLFTARVADLAPGKTLYGHQGTSMGFACNAYFEPESGYAFVMLTNGCNQVRDHNIVVLARRLIAYTYPMVER